MLGFNEKEMKIFRKLDTPGKIQDFLDKIPINFDYRTDTCRSPREVLKKNKCHCIEGAILAAAILRIHGYKPLIVDLEANKEDYDHVLAVFKKNKRWGAITKTNHVVLRYRDAIYKSIRELVMSYFHEYTDKKGRKNMKKYSNPINLSRFDKLNWTTNKKDVWFIPEYLTKIKHFNLISRKQTRSLRKADKLVRETDKLVEWDIGKNKPNKFKIKKY